MAGSLDTVTTSIGSSLDFAMKNFQELAVRIAKIYLITFGIFAAAVAVLAVLALALGGASLLSGNYALLLPLIIVAMIVFIVVGIADACINMVRFIAVEDVAGKRPTTILASAKPLAVPVIMYSISSIILIGVFVGVPILLGVLATAGNIGGIGAIVLILAMIIAVVFAIIISLFIQFAGLDIAINKSGGIDALKNSYSLVRRNLAAVIIYGIILFFISFAIGMVFSLINQVFSLALSIAMLNIAILAVVVAIYLVVAIVESVLINSVLTPVEYFFWKAIGGKR